MSEDRLERALEAMRDENVSPEQLAAAHDRVTAKLESTGLPACAEFEPAFRDYLDGVLAGNRRLLLEDHLSRCTRCRVHLAELKGERKVVAMPARRTSQWPAWATWGAAAAVLLMALYLGRDRVDSFLAPPGPRATVASTTGALYRIPSGLLQPGAALVQDEVIRIGPGTRAVLRLTDGSLVEVNERSELFVRGAWSGQTIHLLRGDIIVQAAKQRRGRLRVQTRDSVAAVKGTVFAVSAGLGGTVVSVVEGSVAVAQPGVDVVLKPGEQAASNRKLAGTVQDAVAWSPDAAKYVELLASIAKIERGLAAFPAPALRTQARLLQYLPAGAVLYGAVPNLGGTIGHAMNLAEQQSAENPVFREWWNSEAGQDLKHLVDRIQTITPLLGEEIVFVLATGAPGGREQVPMLAAEVRAGKQPELVAGIEALRAEAGAGPLPFHITGSVMIVSDSAEHLQWVLGSLGQGASTPFAAAVSQRYQRGAGWLLGMDMESAIPAMAAPPEAGILGVQQMKHLFLEQRDIQGAEENEVTLTFRGPRMGMASWLASTGSGGAAEYLPSDAVLSIYASTREPRQLFDELTAQLSGANPTGGNIFADAESKLGAGFASGLASALGTESAIAIEGLSATGPVWMVAALVNDPATLDGSIRKVVDLFNSELGTEQQSRRITLTQETADGRTWMTMKAGDFPLTVTWTYDRGYLVAGSDRGVVLRAIATRNGGAALIWSAAFQQQLPAAAGIHPSAFVWLNTRGAFEGFASMVSNPTLQKLMAERDPILVVFGGSIEQIRSSSRTRISGLVVDAMLLESVSRARIGTAASNPLVGGPGRR